ncbi:MAG TPA: hypothetical protein VGX75_14370 [bacterium]|nr:hypothetical protein [bacterium]
MEAQVQHPYEPFERRLAGVEVGIARLEGRVDQGFTDMRDRFSSIDGRFDSIDRRFDGVERRFDTLEQNMDRHFFWILSLVIVSILLPVAARLTGH